MPRSMNALIIFGKPVCDEWSIHFIGLQTMEDSPIHSEKLSTVSGTDNRHVMQWKKKYRLNENVPADNLLY